MTGDFSFPFEKLEVWKLSVDLADFIVELMEAFPQNRYCRLIGQMEAAVSSVPQNIAEGSLFEVLTLMELFKRRKLIGEREGDEISES